MESTENAIPNALADQPTDSAPVNATEAPAVSADQPADSAPATVPAEQTTDAEGSEPSKAVKELIAQRKKRQAAEQEAAYWRGVAEARGGQKPDATPQAPAQQAPAVPVPPVLDNFETFEEYEAAKDEYLVQKAEYTLMQKLQQRQQQEKVAQVHNAFWSKVDALENEDPHIKDTVTAVGNMVTPVVADLVVQSELGIELVKHFHKNPAEAKRISMLPPVLAAKELGALEAQLKYTPKPTPPKQVSAAPEPIPTVTPAGNAIVDEDNLPIDQWIERRNKIAGFR